MALVPQYSSTKENRQSERRSANTGNLNFIISSRSKLFVTKFWKLMVSGLEVMLLSHCFLEFMLVSQHINGHWQSVSTGTIN